MRLYLDIDGVLTGHPEYYPGLTTDVVRTDDSFALLDWDIERVHMLLDQFDEVVWATTWILPPSSLHAVEELLDRSFEKVNLTWDNYRRSHLTCGKLAAVRDHYFERPAPFTWIDDHAGPSDYNFTQEQGGRLIVPDYDTGGIYKLMDEDVVFA